MRRRLRTALISLILLARCAAEPVYADTSQEQCYSEAIFAMNISHMKQSGFEEAALIDLFTGYFNASDQDDITHAVSIIRIVYQIKEPPVITANRIFAVCMSRDEA